MASKKHVIDDIRLKIMGALFKEGALTPNISKIQEYTGLHKNTIIQSLSYLKDEGVIEKYEPIFKVNKLGFNAMPFFILASSIAYDSEKVKEFVNRGFEDPHYFQVQKVAGPEEYNLAGFGLYKNIEEYHEHRELYHQHNEDIQQYLRKMIRFYRDTDFIKNVSVSKSAIDILKQETETKKKE